MKIAVLVSGSGTILAAMIEELVPISVVITDRTCLAIDIARNGNIPGFFIDRKLEKYGYKGPKKPWNRKGYTEAIMAVLDHYEIELVALSGFMTILDPVIFTKYGKRVLNIHPSLLPDFKGDSAVQDTLNAGVTVTGTTIHIATAELDDHKYIVAQEKVPVLPGDTMDTLWERIKVMERNLYPTVLHGIINGELILDDILPYWH